MVVKNCEIEPQLASQVWAKEISYEWQTTKQSIAFTMSNSQIKLYRKGTRGAWTRSSLRIQIPIHFVENETVEIVSTNDGYPHRKDSEWILEKILSEPLLSSGFSRGLTMYAVCTITYVKSTSIFCDITHRLVSMLPSIYLSNAGEPGIVSVRSLIKKFGSSSGVELEVRRIVASPNWANAWLDLRFRGLGWFIILNIFWRKNQK